MNPEPLVTFHNLEPTEELKARVREKAERLRTYCDRIAGCRVAVELANRRHKHGNPYRVRINVAVPGDEIVVDHEDAGPTAEAGLAAALHGAFDAARRRLEDYTRRRRHDVKRHETPA